MREAACAIAVSGSVSLELLAARVPTVIVYRISGFAHVVQSWFRHARFITLVNLLAARDPVGPTRPGWRAPREVAPADPEAIFPEYLAVQDPAAQMAEHVVEWLTQPAARESVIARLDAVADRVAHGGSAERAAAAVLSIAAQARENRGDDWNQVVSGTVSGQTEAAPCRPPAHAA
jgi:lipid-A-disaccharide synthase